MHQTVATPLRCSGRVSANTGELWRIVIQSVAKLTVSLTVAVHCLKKPFVYAGFGNLNTDGHRLTRFSRPEAGAPSVRSHSRPPLRAFVPSCETSFHTKPRRHEGIFWEDESVSICSCLYDLQKPVVMPMFPLSRFSLSAFKSVSICG